MEETQTTEIVFNILFKNVFAQPYMHYMYLKKKKDKKIFFHGDVKFKL